MYKLMGESVQVKTDLTNPPSLLQFQLGGRRVCQTVKSGSAPVIPNPWKCVLASSCLGTSFTDNCPCDYLEDDEILGLLGDQRARFLQRFAVPQNDTCEALKRDTG